MSTGNKKRIYIAGKVTGLPREQVVKKFNKAEKLLSIEGVEVLNPTKLVQPDEDWKEAMRQCIRHLTTCDVIYLLPDYFQSEGAMLEHMIAMKLGLLIMHA
jgi:nucleoside 2-deoxyribosyltransferase